MHRTHQSFIIMVLFFGSLILFTWGIWPQEVIGFESRFYLFAQEMWQNGPSWFPTTYHAPYPDYPGLSTFLIYLTGLAFGTLNKFVAMLPSAVAAALTVVMTYLIGALHKKRWGLSAVFLLFMTITFFKSARSIALDIYPALLTTTCFYLVYSADLRNHPQRCWWIYPLLALSFAFRGPIGLIMPAGAVCVYYLLERRFWQCLLTGFFALLTLLVCTAILIALAYHTGGQAFMQDVLRMEVIGRMGDSNLPFYYYLLTALSDYAFAFPLALLVMLGYVGLSRAQTEKQFLLQLTGWLLVILIGMSIPGDKKIRYILPLAPAAALLAAYPLAMTMRQTYFQWLQKIFLSIFFLLPFILWLACIVLPLKKLIHVSLLILVILVLLQLINIGLVFMRGMIKTYRNAWILATATCAFIIVFIGLIEPLALHIERARNFVHQVEKTRLQAGAKLVFYKEGQDGLPIKYLINAPQEEAKFVDNEKDLLAQPKAVFIITRESQFTSLPEIIKSKFKIIKVGSMGHVEMIVFIRK